MGCPVYCDFIWSKQHVEPFASLDLWTVTPAAGWRGGWLSLQQLSQHNLETLLFLVVLILVSVIFILFGFAIIFLKIKTIAFLGVQNILFTPAGSGMIANFKKLWVEIFPNKNTVSVLSAALYFGGQSCVCHDIISATIWHTTLDDGAITKDRLKKEQILRCLNCWFQKWLTSTVLQTH